VTLVKWDARNTLKANYRTLGIADDVNKGAPRRRGEAPCAR
jgi:hypothetical protein